MIRLENISKNYGTRSLIRDLDFHFPEGEKIALVGSNGAGKTSLLRIITGELEPSGGKVLIPSRCRLGYLPQEPNHDPKASVIAECMTGAKHIHTLQIQMDEALAKMSHDPNEVNVERYSQLEAEFSHSGGYVLEARAQQILSGLGFLENLVNQNPTDLSGGWRMRLELAKILLDDPDFLILDEPTNHLDLPSLVWVENYLQKFRGTLLFVSHDRTLLNRLATYTIEVQNGRLYSFKGNFDKFLEQKELRMSQNQATLAQLQNRMAHLQSFVDRFGAKASKATQAQSRVKMINKLGLLQDEIIVEDSPESVFIRLPTPPKAGRIVITLNHVTIGYPNHPLAKDVHFELQRGMKVAIIGANGIGKSTLLKTIFQIIPNLKGDIQYGHNVSLSYFAQDQYDTLDETKSVLDNLMSMNPAMGHLEARKLLGSFLFKGEDVFKLMKVLSGGEKSRLGLACSLARQANFLLLDEPTNHLDMLSVEVLSEALDAYEGSLMFVSHDRNFIDGVCTHILAVLPDGRSQLFEGKMDDYIRMAKVSNFPNVLDVELFAPQKTTTDKAKSNHQIEKDAKKNDTKTLKKIEESISNLQEELIKVEMQMSYVDGSDYQKLSELSESKNSLKNKLSVLEEKWLELNG